MDRRAPPRLPGHPENVHICRRQHLGGLRVEQRSVVHKAATIGGGVVDNGQIDNGAGIASLCHHLSLRPGAEVKVIGLDIHQHVEHHLEHLAVATRARALTPAPARALGHHVVRHVAVLQRPNHRLP
eukprot:CAMPEP_0182854082 /NCGR_PEP_ID=MMETSP0034_2-20130328/1048_1 /TAXON_ID=156128 /ORGANISM="Nephroselmis pyriformis, Strain CCMP717" /LENGTH=126 /DNA_ID=CAMNT_0024984879 /DNA_START=100 /DNA_END=476 /DNA_ORIENTATION=-